MSPPTVLLLALAGVALIILILRWRRRRGRVELKGQSFSPAWTDILQRRVPQYRFLSEPERERLHGHIQVFLAEKHFEGCGGLALTDEIRLTIAGQACLLLLNLEGADYYSRLRSILVYPSTMRPAYAERLTSGTLAPGEEPILGQSWGHGTVILSWDSVRGSAAISDGRNVVLHEFAHQLDQEDGEADGTPFLERTSSLHRWEQTMREHYARLRQAAEGGEATFLDPYGATNPAEFFAVATEAFFETPAGLKRDHPALYDQLARYYRQDPASWGEPPAHPEGTRPAPPGEGRE